jgi:hypothetical protein
MNLYECRLTAIATERSTVSSLATGCVRTIGRLNIGITRAGLPAFLGVKRAIGDRRPGWDNISPRRDLALRGNLHRISTIVFTQRSI